MGELIINVKTRTKVLENGEPRELSEVFAQPYELDIRARSWEQNHEQLEQMEVGGTLDWEYQGFTFRTTVLERREPPQLEI